MPQLRQQVPNLLSSLRILLAILFPFLEPSLRLPVIFLAAASEFFDGYLARRWKAESLLGQSLDPIADKLFVLSTVSVLIHDGSFTWAQFGLIAMRDIVVAVGSFTSVVQGGSRVIESLKPKYSGKLATTLQFLLLISLFAAWPISAPLFVATAFMSCLSAVDYTYAILNRRGHIVAESRNA